MESEKVFNGDVLEQSDSVLELANKSLELGNTLLESFNLLVTLDSTHEGLSNRKPSEVDMLSPNTNARLTRRGRVVKEIAETEKRYVDGLYLLINHFSRAFADSHLLPNLTLKRIFPPCLQHIYLLHSEIYSRLSERVMNWTPRSSITDVLQLYFISNGDYIFNIYQQFLSSFSTSVSTIRLACANDRRVRRLAEALEEAEVCKKLKMTSYMTTPVQRMPRYILLLKELMKVTLKKSQEYTDLEECVTSLGGYLGRLNEGIESSIFNSSGIVFHKGDKVGKSKAFDGKKERDIGARCGGNNDDGGFREDINKGCGGMREGRINGDDSSVGDNMDYCKKKVVKKKSSFKLKGAMIWKTTSNAPLKACRSSSFQSAQVTQPLCKTLRSISNVECKENVSNVATWNAAVAEGADDGGVVVEKRDLIKRLLRSRGRNGGSDVLNSSCVSNVAKVSTLKRKLSSLSDLGNSFRNKLTKPMKTRGGEREMEGIRSEVGLEKS